MHLQTIAKFSKVFMNVYHHNIVQTQWVIVVRKYVFIPRRADAVDKSAVIEALMHVKQYTLSFTWS